MTSNGHRFEIQASLYEFPYHYLPTLDRSGAIAICKCLSWGLEYLTYMTFVARLIAERLKAQSVLDVGCGDGRLLNMLRGKVPRLVGVDLVEQAILFARAFNPEMEFFIGDVSEVPGQFQVTTLIEVMEHIPDEEYPEFINKVVEKTSPDGWLVVSVPTTNVRLNRKHYRHYNLSLLQKHLSPAFTIQHHWFLVKQGWTLRLWNRLLQNQMVVVLPGIWRRMVWRLHQRYTYAADANNGRHLIVTAKPNG